MHTPSFDVKILVAKVRIIRGYLREAETKVTGDLAVALVGSAM